MNNSPTPRTDALCKALQGDPPTSFSDSDANQLASHARQLERELAEAHYNFEVLKAKDDEAIEADRVVSRALGRASRDTEIAALREALRPFANFACDPPCGCHNCRARDLLKPHAQGDAQ